MKGLTDKQKKILAYIEKYSAEHGYPPTIREIGDIFSITAKGAYDHLKAIEKKGYINCVRNRSRAIELLKPLGLGLPGLPPDRSVQIPLVGRVAAGAPIIAEENIEEYLSFPKSMVKGDGLYALRVQGDSMKDAGIFDGDIAIIQKRDSAQDGEIIVALIDDDATLKYFYQDKEKNCARLEPANSAYKPIYTESLLVLGKLVGVYRTI